MFKYIYTINTNSNPFSSLFLIMQNFWDIEQGSVTAKLNTYIWNIFWIVWELPNMLFWFQWKKSNGELVLAYFLCINITTRVATLSVLQENTTFFRISLCIVKYSEYRLFHHLPVLSHQNTFCERLRQSMENTVTHHVFWLSPLISSFTCFSIVTSKVNLKLNYFCSSVCNGNLDISFHSQTIQRHRYG